MQRSNHKMLLSWSIFVAHGDVLRAISSLCTPCVCGNGEMAPLSINWP